MNKCLYCNSKHGLIHVKDRKINFSGRTDFDYYLCRKCFKQAFGECLELEELVEIATKRNFDAYHWDW